MKNIRSNPRTWPVEPSLDASKVEDTKPGSYYVPEDEPLPITIPQDWTPQQAMIVCNFLETVLTAVWETHEKVMVPIIIDEMARDRHTEEEPYSQEGFNDQIPF